MAREIATDEDTSVLVQGFRASKEGVEPYVFMRAMHEEDGFVDVVMTAQQANELGEYLRQEAEFANQPPVGQKEEGK